MMYVKITNLIDNKTDESFKLKNKELGWSKRLCDNVNSQITFKTNIIQFSLCDYRHVNILVKETITITECEADVAAQSAGKTNKKIMFKNKCPIH